MVVEREGDILQSGADVICQQVNCMGVMGAGLAKQVRDKYPSVYIAYKEKCKKGSCLGDAQLCEIGERVIANLFGQEGYGRDKRYTDYDALKNALLQVNEVFGYGYPQRRIALPHGLGCGLAGGDWSVVRPMIEEIFGKSQCVCEIWKYSK